MKLVKFKDLKRGEQALIKIKNQTIYVTKISNNLVETETEKIVFVTYDTCCMI
jgi:hypothetical protein